MRDVEIFFFSPSLFLYLFVHSSLYPFPTISFWTDSYNCTIENTLDITLCIVFLFFKTTYVLGKGK